MKKYILMPLSLMLLAGCGSSTPSNGVEVSGMVMMDGQPLDAADITFISDKSSGSGRTDASGKFSLIQPVPAGSYRVVVSRLDGATQPVMAAAGAAEGLDAGQLSAMAFSAANDPTRRKPARPAAPKQVVPPIFSDPQQTTLSIDIPEDGTESADFQLTSR